MKTNYSSLSRYFAVLTIVLTMLLSVNTLFAQNNSPLCFTARNGSANVRFVIKNITHTIQYSIDNINWSTYTSDTYIDIDVNQSVYFRAATNQSTATEFGRLFFLSSRFYFSSYDGGTIEGSGNIMSLYGPDCPNLSLQPYAFATMFWNCDILTMAPSLPATSLDDYCYSNMFSGCTSLTTAPALPATSLANYCYSNMFSGCTSLTTAPTLPATSLANNCYSNMFSGCTSLTTAPALPATSLANYCYSNMFSGCTSLTTAPALPATSLANYCYSDMFSDCTSLTTAPALPASILTEYCYQGMFNGCTSLVAAPALPATSLANYCYSDMFSDCTSLTTAPALPASILTEYCYQGMFNGCTSLVAAPALPASFLNNYCYSEMFSGCSSLTVAPSLPAVILVNGCYHEMFRDCISLINIPTMPATSLARNCYYRMFRGCIMLATTPLLSDTILTESCYREMFYGCTSITKVPELPATTLVDNCYNQMFYGCSSLVVNTAGPGTRWAISATNTATDALTDMFYGTGGTMNSTPTINTIYFNSSCGHMINVCSNDSTIGNVSGAGYYEHGDIATLMAKANPHYHLASWNNGATTTTIYVVVTSDSTFTANFEIDKHIITTKSNNDAYGAVVGGGAYDYGTTVTLTAIPNEGYHFVSWNNGSTSTSISTIVTNDTTFIAKFAPNIHNVLVLANYADRGAVTGGGQFNHNDIATLTATPNTGYVFSRWDNGETDRILYVTVKSDTVITAMFDPVSTDEDYINEDVYTVFAENNQIVVIGAFEVFIYDVVGRVVFNGKMESEIAKFIVPAAGIYFINVDHKKNYRIVVR